MAVQGRQIGSPFLRAQVNWFAHCQRESESQVQKNMKTHKLRLTAPVSSTTPTPRRHCSPYCSGLGAQGLITTTAEASRTHGCQALPPPECCQLTTKENSSLKSKDGVWGQIAAQRWTCLLCSSFSSISNLCQWKVAVCHHQGRCSAEKRATKQRAGLYTCHLQLVPPWASYVCVHTHCPCLTWTLTAPCCTFYHLQPCFVIRMQKASATTQISEEGASVYTLFGSKDFLQNT